MSVALERETEAAGEAEVCNFNVLLALVDKEVGGLEVPVHDAALMAVEQALQHLVDNRARLCECHRLAPLVKILLHVLVEKLEGQVELVLAMDDVQQVDNAWVAKLAQESDLADGSAGNTLVTVLNFDLFESYSLQTG